ncbi:PaaI family thioesterase [Draconibacterium sediminis]|uniref:DUF4442 domain-containing protein n=1 Tax=Draconibacterium sediminis TaxID=1544798 RepID=A0A0D8J5C2_9BACT|nr:YiiD C-terminal domain-containing protein [Draconibacterium sediminis]KJF42170.1 hypothetical protein LH29_20410 [Draconibacterium sediminis]
MNTIDLPLNKHTGLKKMAKSTDYIFTMPPDEKLLNHLGTLHAGALFILAEATSGEFLLEEFKTVVNKVVPVVRKAEIKFSKPANGIVYSKADYVNSDREEALLELESRKRTNIKVKVDLYNTSRERVFSSVFCWFIIMN